MKAVQVRASSSYGTCTAGPWCDRRVEDQELCDSHREQLARTGELKPLEGTIENLLFRVIPQPDLTEGICTTSHPDIFTEVRTQKQAERAVDYCAGCPVLDECRDWALSTHDNTARNEGDPWPVTRVVQGGIWFQTRTWVDLLDEQPLQAAA